MKNNLSILFLIPFLILGYSCSNSKEDASTGQVEDAVQSDKIALELGDYDVLLYVKVIIVGQFDKETKGTIVDEEDGIIKTDQTVVILRRNGLNEVLDFEIISDKIPISPLILSVNDMAINNVDNDLPIIKHYYIDEVIGRELSGGLVEDSPSEKRLTYYYSPGDRYTKTITFAYEKIENAKVELIE
jgi:hypothetical protein